MTVRNDVPWWFDAGFIGWFARAAITQRRKEKGRLDKLAGLSLYMARPEGFEPPTAWFVARYSIQLSYGRVL